MIPNWGNTIILSANIFIVCLFSYYPIYPPSEDVCVDYEVFAQHARLPCKPDILIVPSDLKYFAKVSDSPKQSYNEWWIIEYTMSLELVGILTLHVMIQIEIWNGYMDSKVECWPFIRKRVWNIGLYYLYRQFTNLFIFRFVSHTLCLCSTLRLLHVNVIMTSLELL